MSNHPEDCEIKDCHICIKIAYRNMYYRCQYLIDDAQRWKKSSLLAFKHNLIYKFKIKMIQNVREDMYQKLSKKID